MKEQSNPDLALMRSPLTQASSAGAFAVAILASPPKLGSTEVGCVQPSGRDDMRRSFDGVRRRRRSAQHHDVTETCRLKLFTHQRASIRLH